MIERHIDIPTADGRMDGFVVDPERGGVLKFLGGEPVRQGPKGTIGYCLGGRLALAAAAEFPDQLRANASMHGTRLVSDKPDSPHRFVDNMRGEIYCGFAEKDDLAPP